MKKLIISLLILNVLTVGLYANGFSSRDKKLYQDGWKDGLNEGAALAIHTVHSVLGKSSDDDGYKPVSADEAWVQYQATHWGQRDKK